MTGKFELGRSIIYDCPALILPQSFLQKLGGTTQMVVLKGADDDIAKRIVDALNAADIFNEYEAAYAQAQELAALRIWESILHCGDPSLSIAIGWWKL